MYTHIFLGTTSSACIMFQFLRGFSRLTIDTGQPIGVLYLRGPPPPLSFFSCLSFFCVGCGFLAFFSCTLVYPLPLLLFSSRFSSHVGEILWFSFCNSFFQISDLLVRFVIRYILMIKYSKRYFWYDSFQLQMER